VIPAHANFKEKIRLYVAHMNMTKCSSNTIMIRFLLFKEVVQISIFSNTDIYISLKCVYGSEGVAVFGQGRALCDACLK
jgi:hypothetical protein